MYILLKTSCWSILLIDCGQLWNQFDFMQFGLRLLLVCNKFVFDACEFDFSLIKRLLKEASMRAKIYRNGKDCAWYHVSVNTSQC
jgi:hypothetical protein